MNRPGIGPQSLRGLPNGFSAPPPPPQPRSASSRIPNGKIANNNGTWAFGSVPMGNTTIPNQRTNTGMASFAQSIGGSQPNPNIDLADFPSLSTNQPQHATSNAWTMPPARNLGQGLVPRAQQPSTQAQQQTQQQQDDLFSSSSQLPSLQTGFKFGNQSAVGQSSQAEASTSDDFPPLSRNINGDIGQDRGQGILQNVGFGAQTSNNVTFGGASVGSQSGRGNGLLNALSGNMRPPSNVMRDTSPPNLGGLSASRSPIEPRQGTGISLDGDSSAFARASQSGLSSVLGLQDHIVSQATMSQPASIVESTNDVQLEPPHRRQQSKDFGIHSSQETSEEPVPDIEDPLAGLSEKDRYGLKGLISTLKGQYVDQAALITGIDINNLGFDLNSTEKLSEQIWSPFDETAARPAVPKYSLPECYQVHNVQPIENKLSNFSDETLMFMFYSNPLDIQQMIAAQELANRNWRYHKKAQLWLTKDDMMVPQPISNNTEQGYYVFFDPKTWSRERRHFVLIYDDLEAVPQVLSQL